VSRDLPSAVMARWWSRPVTWDLRRLNSAQLYKAGMSFADRFLGRNKFTGEQLRRYFDSECLGHKHLKHASRFSAPKIAN
jgi:hypothetical protein